MMQRKLNQSGQFDKPAWDWTPVQCVLKTTQNNRKSIQWQLAPSILLTNPTSTNSDPNVRLFIDTQKSLSYAPDLGWNWHKSWNLPNISIRLQIKDQATGQQLLTPKNIFAQIFAVKKNGDNQRTEKIILLDVGIRGQSKMQMIDGQVYFSAMKFSSTTYNNQGQNFHLLIVIYIQENQSEKPKVLTAVISPQIFVDSRRSARDYQQKKFNSFVQPFSTDQLEKQFIKRQNKSRTQQQIQIRNDPEGFYNYLTAPNIRHKVKHPIFLAIRFSNCVTILFNSQRIAELLNNEYERQGTALTTKQIMQILQKKLLKQSQTKNVRQDLVVSNIKQKLFLFVVQNISDSLKRKKVMESIQTLQSQSFGVVEDEKQIPPEFKRLDEYGPLSKIYKDNYQLLKQLCRKYIPSDQESSGQESDQEYGKSEEVKKIKVNKLENGNQFTFNNAAIANRKPKPANIVCQTIPTVDSKPNLINQGKEDIKTQKNPQPSSAMRLLQKEKEDKIKQEQQYGKEASYSKPAENLGGFKPIVSSNSQPQPAGAITNPQTTSSFTLNLGSKKGAFNNLRTPQPQKNEVYNSQFGMVNNAALGTGFTNTNTANPNNNFGLGALGGLGGMSGLGGLGALGMNGGLGALANMNAMSYLNGMGSMSGVPSMNSLAGLSGLNSLATMPGMNPLGNLGAMGGLGNMNLSGYQGMNANSMNGLLRNGSNFANTNSQSNAQNNLNTQAKSLESLLCSNLMLSNWLNSVKSNNQSLYQTMKPGSKLDDQQMKPTDTKVIQDSLNDLTRMSPQLQEQQSMLCLLQQINLYRELLAQVTYQNQLLGRNMNGTGGSSSSGGSGANQIQDLLMQNGAMGMGMAGMGALGGGLGALGSLGGMAGLGTIGAMGGLPSGLGSLGNLGSLAGLGGLNSMNNNMNNLNNMRYRGFQPGKESQGKQAKQEHQD